MLLNKTIWPKSKISPLNMKLLDVFAVFVLHDIELPGVHTEHVFNQFRSISHSEVWLNTLHLCIWIFYLQFLFCTILKWSPAARCADHVSHQFCSKRQLIIIFAICVLHFSILHFTFFMQPIFPMSFAAIILHQFCNHYFCINFNFAATDRDLCGHCASWLFGSRCQRNIA